MQVYNNVWETKEQKNRAKGSHRENWDAKVTKITLTKGKKITEASALVKEKKQW